MLYAHITLQELDSLTEQEKDMLFYICNVLFPIRPPFPTEEDKYPVATCFILAAIRDSVIQRITSAEPKIKEEALEIYNGLRSKLGLSLVEIKKVEPPKEEPKTEEPKIEEKKE
jgi:hypothetical protein